MKAKAGSQLHIQELIRLHPEVLTREIQKVFGINTSIKWVSPLESEGFKEYRDETAIEKLGIDLHEPLATFWPKRGPVWDALGVGDKGESFLIEAKANIEEMISPPTKAKSASSIALIKSSLTQVKEALGIKNEFPWSGQFYQYFNRVAWLYFLREINKHSTYLIFLYFTGSDVMGKYCPVTAEEWHSAIYLMQSILQAKRHRLSRYIAHIVMSAHRRKI